MTVNQPGSSFASGPYQVMPDLTEVEYNRLLEDIKENGILQPVVKDEQGNTLDGHHREKIAVELGIECPTVVVSDLADDDAKLAYAVKVNVYRRQLSPKQRVDLIRKLRAEGWSIRRIVQETGVPYTTVHRDVQSGQSGGDPNGSPEEVQGRDGKTYKGRLRQMKVNLRRQHGSPTPAPRTSQVDYKASDAAREVFKKFLLPKLRVMDVTDLIELDNEIRAEFKKAIEEREKSDNRGRVSSGTPATSIRNGDRSSPKEEGTKKRNSSQRPRAVQEVRQYELELAKAEDDLQRWRFENPKTGREYTAAELVESRRAKRAVKEPA